MFLKSPPSCSYNSPQPTYCSKPLQRAEESLKEVGTLFKILHADELIRRVGLGNRSWAERHGGHSFGRKDSRIAEPGGADRSGSLRGELEKQGVLGVCE